MLDPPGKILRSVEADEWPTPAAVLVGRGPTGIGIEWLPIGCGDMSAGSSDTAARGIVWHSRLADEETRIVDAA